MDQMNEMTDNFSTNESEIIVNEAQERDVKFIETLIVKFIDLVNSEEFKTKKEIVLNASNTFAKLKSQFKIRNIHQVILKHQDEVNGKKVICIKFDVKQKLILDINALPEETKNSCKIVSDAWYIKYLCCEETDLEILRRNCIPYHIKEYLEEELEIIEASALEDDSTFRKTIIDYVLLVESEKFKNIKKDVTSATRLIESIKKCSKKYNIREYKQNLDGKSYYLKFDIKEINRINPRLISTNDLETCKKYSEIWRSTVTSFNDTK